MKEPMILTLVLTISLIVYFIPTVIAVYRHHRNSIPLFIVNLAVGWTFLGWFACLAWSFSDNVKIRD